MSRPSHCETSQDVASHELSDDIGVAAIVRAGYDTVASELNR